MAGIDVYVVRSLAGGWVSGIDGNGYPIVKSDQRSRFRFPLVEANRIAALMRERNHQVAVESDRASS